MQDGEYNVLQEHLQSLEQSAGYFQFPVNLETIEKKLLDYQKQLDKGDWKIRLLLARKGSFFIEAREVTPMSNYVEAALAGTPVEREDIFLYHKTTNRTMYKENYRSVTADLMYCYGMQTKN